MKALIDRNEYPATLNYTYLNTPATGLISAKSVQFRHEADKLLMETGSVKRELIWEEMEQVKQSLSNLFAVAQDRVALVPSFSYGFNLLLPLLKDKKFLVLENEYPSLLWPIELSHVDRTYVPNDEHIEANILAAVQQGGIEVLAMSIVQFSNGLQIDLSFLKELKRKYPELIIVLDGTQFLGTDSFNFDDSRVDVVIASAYKWLCAGFGNGSMFFSQQFLDGIQPTSAGYNTFKIFSTEGIVPKSNFFEPGHQDLMNFGTLGLAAETLQKLGLNTIQRHNAGLIKEAYDLLLPYGVVNEGMMNRKSHSSIIVLKDNKPLYNCLEQHGILCIHRNGIRIGFHFYNSSEDVQKLAEVVAFYFKN